jgi:hypothetical protein
MTMLRGYAHMVDLCPCSRRPALDAAAGTGRGRLGLAAALRSEPRRYNTADSRGGLGQPAQQRSVRHLHQAARSEQHPAGEPVIFWNSSFTESR